MMEIIKMMNQMLPEKLKKMLIEIMNWMLTKKKLKTMPMKIMNFSMPEILMVVENSKQRKRVYIKII